MVESTFSLVDIARKSGGSGSKTSTIVADSLESNLNKKLEEVKKRSNKIKFKSLMHAYMNFFLYDLESMIKPTFVTELGKDFSIYGMIFFLVKPKKITN